MTQRTFPNAPASVPEVRRFAAGRLADVDGSVVETVVLMLSELATNCVRYTDTPFRVSIERRGRKVRVEVTDEGGGEPMMRSPGPREPTGRGLRIVEAFADEWGVTHPERGRGKCVWFTIETEPAHA